MWLAAVGVVCHATSADAATRTWKAFTVDNVWSNPANWEEGAAPVDGDDLRFPQPGVTPATVVNDIADLHVNTIRTDSNFIISGQPFTLLHGMTGSGTAVYQVHITAAGSQSWVLNFYTVTLNGGLTIDGTFTSASGILSPGALRIPGVLSGNGMVIVTGANALELFNANTYTGPTSVIFGRIRISHANALGVGDGTIANGTVLDNGHLEFTQPVVLDDELIELRSGSLTSSLAGTLTGPVQVKGSAMMDFDGNLHLSGTLEFTGQGLPTLNVSGAGTLDLTGAELSIVLPEGFSAAIGKAFTIVDVDGANPITGTFAGLPQGGSFTVGSFKFAISYTGGTGNDVVLTVAGIDRLYYLSEGATGSFFSTDILLAVWRRSW
jgi:hypothetical protein